MNWSGYEFQRDWGPVWWFNKLIFHLQVPVSHTGASSGPGCSTFTMHTLLTFLHLLTGASTMGVEGLSTRRLWSHDGSGRIPAFPAEEGNTSAGSVGGPGRGNCTQAGPGLFPRGEGGQGCQRAARDQTCVGSTHPGCNIAAPCSCGEIGKKAAQRGLSWIRRGAPAGVLPLILSAPSYCPLQGFLYDLDKVSV